MKPKLLFFLTIAHVILALSCKNPNNNGATGSLKSDSLSNKESVNPYATHDQSPLDMSYFPKDYPILRMNGADSAMLVARVIYSRPQKKGRIIFGDSEKSLVHFGKEWRLGANEATEIEFFRTVDIAGKQIKAGRYIIYCIPFNDRWTIVLNSNLNTWGLHMDPVKDIFKIDIPVQQQTPALEDFTMIFEPAPTGASLIMAWDNVKTVLPISFPYKYVAVLKAINSSSSCVA